MVGAAWTAVLACLLCTAVAPAAVVAPAAAVVASAAAPGSPAAVHMATIDGRYSLQIWARAQVRDTVNHNPNATPDLTNRVELKRASLFLAGNVFRPHTKYFMQLVFDPRDLGMQGGQVTQSPLFDLFFTFDYLRDLSLRVGQYKPYFSRQFISGWGDLQFVDRSIVQQEFLLDRDIGFDLFSNDLGGLDLFRYSLGVYAGQGRNNFTPREFRMSYLARLEVLPLGGFDEYVEADLERRRMPKLALGVAYEFSDHAQKDHGVNGLAPADGGTGARDEAAARLFSYLVER